MELLLIEDDDIKADIIMEFLTEESKLTDSIIRKQSWQSGIIEIINNKEKYNLVLLDMSMPRYDANVGDVNEEFETFAGWDILREMKRRDIILKVCVITSFDYFGEGENVLDSNTLNEELEEEFPKLYKGMIYFNSSQINWKEELKQLILKGSL
ncbi:hypothetical protein ACLHWY_23495 [Priestia aryabhattai]|uniref:hypothetical protein n=1 Tax=Priestia aryabhattai TaxID=412384 RepID=UPI003982E58C